MELVGEKVRVRPVEASDTEELYHWWNDREFAGKYGGFFPMNRPQFEVHLTQGWWFLVETLAEKKKVGFVSYYSPRSDYANLYEVGYRTKPGERRRGYTTEAVRLLVDHLFETRKEIVRVESVTDVDNFPSQRVLEKSGFEREALLKKRFFSEGEYRDEYMYAILREDWQGNGRTGAATNP